ncbi:MAG: glycosyltransferase [Candidatus Eremiobacteraeota bacterium]|nr:glycosyltransferase [Candidatus Eremiobacteraeota bacterium]
MFLSIVIPAYNEATRLPRTLEATIEYLSQQSYESEILVVSDGSGDDTIPQARKFSEQFPNLRCLEYFPNRGKGYAVKTGMLEAKGDFVLFMDADYAVPIAYVERLLQQMDKADLVIGSRTLQESVLEKRQPVLREFAARVFGRLQQAWLGLPFRDTQCGFKLFRREIVQKLFLTLTFECSYFDAELLHVAWRSGVRIRQVPVTWSHDGETRLPIGFRRTLDLLAKLWRIRRQRRRLTVHENRDYKVADYEKRQSDPYANAKYHIILKWLPKQKGLRVLNAGCGSGEMTALLARDHSWAIDAVDPDADSIALHRAAIAEMSLRNVEVFQTPLEEHPGAGYDVVVCNDVLEHIEDDRAAVARLHAILRPGGKLCVSVPALPSLYGYHDEKLGHYRRYTRVTLEELLEPYFVVRRIRYFAGVLVPIAWIYSCLLRRPYPLGGKQSLSMRLVALLLWVETHWRLPFGTTLLLEAEPRPLA